MHYSLHVFVYFWQNAIHTLSLSPLPSSLILSLWFYLVLSFCIALSLFLFLSFSTRSISRPLTLDPFLSLKSCSFPVNPSENPVQVGSGCLPCPLFRLISYAADARLVFSLQTLPWTAAHAAPRAIMSLLMQSLVHVPCTLALRVSLMQTPTHPRRVFGALMELMFRQVAGVTALPSIVQQARLTWTLIPLHSALHVLSALIQQWDRLAHANYVQPVLVTQMIIPLHHALNVLPEHMLLQGHLVRIRRIRENTGCDTIR